MTINEAILKTLNDAVNPLNTGEVYNNIVLNGYYNFTKSKTPTATISAYLGDYIRNGDSRVRRVKKSDGIYYYYLAKNEERFGIDLMHDEPEIDSSKLNLQKIKGYKERDLHILLSSYLNSTSIYSKTIFHEQSNGKESNQIWTHPDMVGINFLKLQTKASQNFLKSINRVDTFKLSSYELKREINSDNDLKQAYFQAVSNSSWANYGYLVAFEFNDSLHEEMSRLNQSFGIGVIELNANPFQSKVVFPAVYRDLDFKTIDKLCKMNKEFEKFIEQTEKLLTATEKYLSGAEKELDEFCDAYFLNDTESLEYCKEKNIPLENK